MITEIKKVGKGERYKIFIDDTFSCILESEVIIKNKLKIGQEISQDKLEQIKIENGNISSFDRALTYLEHGLKTEKEVRDYLFGKTFPLTCVEQTIEKLREYGYINDSNYAENYIKTYSLKMGRRKLKFQLKTKGVADEIIEESLFLLPTQQEEESCFLAAQKYLKNKAFDCKTRQKLYAFLAGRGYGSEIISKCMREIENDRN